jgi:pimeloyl-ACP methyl ester carboxylesterase
MYLVVILLIALSAACAHSGSMPMPSPAARASPPAKPAPPKPSMATSTDGVRIAFTASGRGPALILLHGGGQDRSSWNERGYVKALADSFTVIALDERGSGHSDRPRTPQSYALERVLGDVLAVADAAGAPRFHVWGFGRGATIARYLAARSDRVISAVLVGATMGPPVTGVAREGMIAMRDSWQPLLASEQAGTLDLTTLPAGTRAALTGDTPITALAVGALVEYPSLEPAEIKAPTLWVVGADDSAAMANAKAYKDRLAGTAVTLEVLTGASFTDCFARTADVLKVVKPFLAREAVVAPQS